VGDLRVLENQSIEWFVQQALVSGFLFGRVLDYGCGKQPYREIIEKAGREYMPFDRAALPANVSGEDIGVSMFANTEHWDSILCTQVLQYIPDPARELRRLRTYLVDNGYLVVTYPTNWPEVEDADLHRFTKAGMQRLLKEAGFTVVRHDWRAGFTYEGVSFALGYGAVARA
jgi:trans-aconitate methyltransferase